MKNNFQPKYLSFYDKGHLQALADRFWFDLANCRYCPRKCGANRLLGMRGYCKADDKIRIGYYGSHFGEEPPISGTKGSGTIFFAGCPLRCVYCQNYQISQPIEIEDIPEYTIEALADIMMELQNKGCHNINLVSASPYIPHFLKALLLAIPKGFNLPFVFNSSGYENLDIIQQLSAIINIYLPDCRYKDQNLSAKYSRSNDYFDTAFPVIKEMVQQTQPEIIDDNGIMQRGTIIRHLVLPNHTKDSKDILKLLKDQWNDNPPYISVMFQYFPVFKAKDHPDINRTLTKKEMQEILDYIEHIDIQKGFIQEHSSTNYGIPDFEQNEAFKWKEE